MFGKRSDGRRLKNVPSFFKVIPLVMKTRSDSQCFYTEEILLEGLDNYIDKKAQENIKISYMDIIYAALVRVMALRPGLNRFVMNGRTYARDGIYVSLAIKKELTDEGQETTIKLPFTGKENIFEIKEVLNKEIAKNKEKTTENSTDVLATTLGVIPTWLLKIAVNFLMFMDKHGILPKAVINASPFHTSVFLTNVASIGIDAIYHHLYDFGTTGMFLAMGKKKKSYVYEDETLKVEKCMSFAFVIDERICDGYYFANSIKIFKRLLKNPELLEKNVEKVEDIK